MAEFVNFECSDDEEFLTTEELSELITVCNCSDKTCDVCKDKSFINDDDIDEVDDVHNHRKRDLTESLEKLRVANEIKPVKRRNLTSSFDALQGGSLNEGVYSYPLTQTETNQIESIIEDAAREGEFEQPKDTEVIAEALSKEAQIGRLRSSFFHFSLAGGKNEGARFTDLFRSMQSEKTMQKLWAIYIPRPKTGLRLGPKYSHVAIEAILATDCDRIRARHGDTHVLYVVEYDSTSRSMSGLKQLLKRVTDNEALFGVPLIKKPLCRSWIKDFTMPLCDDPNKDFVWLSLVTDGPLNKTDLKFNNEEMLVWVETEKPYSVEVFIANYRKEAQMGNENAQAWIQMTSALTIAKKTYELWRSAIKGAQHQLGLPEFITQRCEAHSDGDPHNITRLLTYNRVAECVFVSRFRKWLKGHIKHNILCFVGPGNSGKSMLCEAFTLCLSGAFLSWHEHNMFWKSPMIGKRFCYVDDISRQAWRFFDVNERHTLDGGIIAVNKKFAESAEMRMPPCLMTTNDDIRGNDEFVYLTNRIIWIDFPRSIEGTDIVVKAQDCAAWIKLHETDLDLD